MNLANIFQLLTSAVQVSKIKKQSHRPQETSPGNRSVLYSSFIWQRFQSPACLRFFATTCTAFQRTDTSWCHCRFIIQRFRPCFSFSAFCLDAASPFSPAFSPPFTAFFSSSLRYVQLRSSWRADKRFTIKPPPNCMICVSVT